MKILNKTYTFLKRVFYFRKNKKAMPVNLINEEDLQRLGRKLGDNVSLSHNNPKPYSVAIDDDEQYYSEELPEPSTSTMQIIRNKKNGRTMVCPGNIEQIKAIYNNDWEVVESEIKG